MNGQGHNSAAYGQELRGEVETVLSDDHVKLFHYAKWHLGDYITGTQGMSLEHEGAYMRFLVRLYDRGKPFPDDDRFMCTVMGLSLRVWRRIRDTLVTVGKIICRNGSLTNARFERERQKRAEELRKQVESARKRWENERAKQRRNGEVSQEFGESLGEVSPKIQGSDGEKSNKINGDEVATHMPPRDQRLESTEKERTSFSESARATKGKRGSRTRLSPDWELPPEWRAATKSKFGINDAQIDREAARFKRYWTSPDAKKPLKADWPGTWENWIDRALDNGIRPAANRGNGNYSLNGTYTGELL